MVDFPDSIKQAVARGVLIISGSRSIRGAFQWGHYALTLAEDRGWAVAVGDAQGVDSAIYTAWLSPAHRCNTALIILGCKTFGRIRILGVDHHPITWLVPGGDLKTCWLKRNEALCELGQLAPRAGFMALWDGSSRGTIHTAQLCRNAGIPGFVQKGQQVIYRWEAGG